MQYILHHETYLMSGASNDGWKHSSWCIIASKAGLTHARPIVDNQSSNFIISHFWCFKIWQLQYSSNTLLPSSIPQNEMAPLQLEAGKIPVHLGRAGIWLSYISIYGSVPWLRWLLFQETGPRALSMPIYGQIEEAYLAPIRRASAMAGRRRHGLFTVGDKDYVECVTGRESRGINSDCRATPSSI